MTAAAQPRTQAEPDPPRPPVDGSDATAFGDVVRFNAQDGLFLRAEHLAVMQTYAAQLSRAVGVATGTGVVYGFRPVMTEDGTCIEISPGLAIDPTGRPLYATNGMAVVRLKDAPSLENVDGFLVLEIGPAALPFGTEPVFGNLCDDPCSGSVRQPWVAEGVVARLQQDALTGFSYIPSQEKRSWLASHYFERQRRDAAPWLVPTGPDAAITPITGRDWRDVAEEPSEVGVPLGVVWRDGEKWKLDVWTARREIGGRRGEDRWRTRLAMRPSNAFLAQVLQFQDQLSALPVGWANAVPPEAVPVDALREHVAAFVQAVSDTPVRNWHDYKELLAAFEQTSGRQALLTADTPLRDRGFVELPPAGLLPAPLGEDPEAVIRGWLPDIDVRFCSCRADHVPSAIEQARDLDRIPLRPSGMTPRVDVLVPDRPADLDALVADSYGWVAFVRRHEVECVVEPPEPPTDLVEVRYHQAALDTTINAYTTGEPPGSEIVRTVTYPKDGWEFPGPEAAAAIQLVDGDVEVIAVATSQTRLPLAVLRASLFFASLVQEGDTQLGRTVRQVHAVVAPASASAKKEYIVVVQPGGGGEGGGGEGGGGEGGGGEGGGGEGGGG
jgi:hypothetical protein